MKVEQKCPNIPNDDIECWERYPKHRWVYETSRLLDSQGIKWSPYKSESTPNRELSINLFSAEPLVMLPGYIYTKQPTGISLISEICILKGEIKHIQYRNIETETKLNEPDGEIELKLSAFVSLYFAKFTGIITCTTHGTDVFSVQLRPAYNVTDKQDIEVARLIKRIYKKSDITI